MAVALETSNSLCSTQQQCLHSTRDQFLYIFSHSNAKGKGKKTKRPSPLCVKATFTNLGLGFSDPSWKQKFQENWDKRFNLPRITDIYDLKPRPTTFSMKKNRTSTSDENGTPMDMWNGYMNNQGYHGDKTRRGARLPSHLLGEYGVRRGDAILTS